MKSCFSTSCESSARPIVKGKRSRDIVRRTSPSRTWIEDAGAKTVRTEGLWVKCESCEQVIWKADLEANLWVCPKCGFHFRMGSTARIEMLLDPGFELVDRD